eukprot:404255-Prymnesium_polylepis.3
MCGQGMREPCVVARLRRRHQSRVSQSSQTHVARQDRTRANRAALNESDQNLLVFTYNLNTASGFIKSGFIWTEGARAAGARAEARGQELRMV